MRNRSVFLSRTSALLSFLGVISCGGQAMQPIAPPPVAACLTFYLHDEVRGDVYDRDVESAVRQATVTGLVQAGFSVVRDPAAPHDVEAVLSVSPGSRVETGALVRAALVIEGGEGPIDRFETTLPQNQPGYAPTMAAELVDGIFRSSELAGFIRKLRRPESNATLAITAGRKLASEAPKDAAAPAVCPEPSPPPPPPPPPPEFVIGTPQPSAYALVVGIEQYKAGMSAKGARSDAERFSRMVGSTLGLPQEHIKILLDEKADKLGLELALGWLSRNVTKDARVYFYFAGMGGPGAALGAPLVLPHDADPKSLEATGFPMWSLLKKLGDTGVKEVLAVFDACYAGAGGRSVPNADGKPARTVREPSIAPQVFWFSGVRGVESTQLAPSLAPSGSGGLFTSWLLSAIGRGQGDIDGDGRVSLEELQTWAGARVSRDAKRLGGEQTPILLSGSAAPKPSAFYVVSGLATP